MGRRADQARLAVWRSDLGMSTICEMTVGLKMTAMTRDTQGRPPRGLEGGRGDRAMEREIRERRNDWQDWQEAVEVRFGGGICRSDESSAL